MPQDTSLFPGLPAFEIIASLPFICISTLRNKRKIGKTGLLPPENWGFPATQIFLGSNFDAVDLEKFYVTTNGYTRQAMTAALLAIPKVRHAPHRYAFKLQALGTAWIIDRRQFGQKGLEDANKAI